METNETNTQTITITVRKYNELLDDQLLLRVLQSAGVDNWDGYDYALEEYRKLSPAEKD